MGIFEDKRKELDIMDAWTENELASYQERDRNFIRDIQIKRGISKDEAKKEFMKYLNSSDGSKKKLKLRNEIRQMLKQGSPPTHTKPIPIQKEHYRQPPKKKKKQPSGKSNSPKVQKRLKSASKKYPDASDYEKRHGVNSKASQKYRLNNGRSRYYEGRIIPKDKQE